jgi:hypothetical protein
MFAALLFGAAAAATPAQAQLQPWADFAGHCWRGEAPGHGGIDTHCFELLYGGQHLRDRHVVTQGGKAVYEGESVYSVERGKVSFTYWNSLGGLGRGMATADGPELRFTGTIHATADSPEQPMNGKWRKVDGGYEVFDGDKAPPRLFKRAD